MSWAAAIMFITVPRLVLARRKVLIKDMKEPLRDDSKEGAQKCDI